MTLAVPLIAPLQFAYPAPSLRVALDTGGALIGLLATAIVVRGCREDLRLDRLLLAAGLAVMALTSAVLMTLLAVAPGAGPRATMAITGTLVGAALLLAGAFAPMRRPRSPRAAVFATVAVDRSRAGRDGSAGGAGSRRPGVRHRAGRGRAAAGRAGRHRRAPARHGGVLRAGGARVDAARAADG